MAGNKPGPAASPGGYDVGLHFPTAAETLAAAIVLQAVEDYRALLAGKKPKAFDGYPDAMMDSLEQFFRSTYFAILTGISGEWLMRALQEEAKRGRVKMKPHTPTPREAAIIYECGLNPTLYYVERERFPYLYIKDKRRGENTTRLTLDIERKMVAYSGKEGK